MLQTEQRVVNVVNDQKFKKKLPNTSLRDSVYHCALQYKNKMRCHHGLVIV